MNNTQIFTTHQSLPGKGDYPSYTTQALRDSYLIDDLFVSDRAVMRAVDLDRAIVGGIIPGGSPVEIVNAEDSNSEALFDRREGGVINIGGAGYIHVDGTQFEVNRNDCLYIGRGSRTVQCCSKNPSEPAVFYMVSYPAHHDYPTTVVSKTDARQLDLGSSDSCNERTIFQFIHEEGIRSCQLVMGMTEIKTGSIWNTMPCHTHARRSEIYLYYNIKPSNQVLHMMGEPNETRPLWVKDRQAVLSPSWSIHCGVGTASYSFIWAMGGENQRFEDMDAIAIDDLK